MSNSGFPLNLPQMSSWIIAVILVVFGGLWSFAYLRAKQRSNDRQLPPGPPGLPILGNLHLLGNFPHRSLHRLAEKYGPIMYIRLGLVPTIVVSSPQVAELFLKTHDLVFASRPKAMAPEYLFYGNKGVVGSPSGSYWRNMRKLCTIQLLSNSKIDSFKPMRREEVGHLVRSIKDAAEAGAVVDLSAKVGSVIEDMTYRMVVGSKDDQFNIKPLIEEALKLTGAFNLADYVPFSGVLDLQGLGRRMKAISRVLDVFLEKIIDEHVRNTNQGQHKDFVDVMLSLIDSKDAVDEQQPYMLDRTNIKAIILDILAATMDTSTTATEWALAELLKHKRMMIQLQEELKREVGTDRMVEEGDLVKLNYLDMVVKESMRLHPVAPLLVPHESMEDIEINGYHIPGKSRIIVNAWAIGRDPQVWSSDADEFSPERFRDSKIDVRGHDFQLIPFGSGRRGCPGMQLGLTVVRFVVAQLVHCFDWELPNGMLLGDLDMNEKFGVTVSRANHLLAVPTYRLHVNL